MMCTCSCALTGLHSVEWHEGRRCTRCGMVRVQRDTPVAVLCADPRGVYAGRPGVEVWGVARDARNYRGGAPVVAHPPCARWGSLAKLVEAVHGVQAFDDGGLFAAVLDLVRRCAGVIEHPHRSRAWVRHGLTPPAAPGVWSRARLDSAEEWTTIVAQRHYGHRATKWTWLLAVGLPILPRLPAGCGPPPSHTISPWLRSREAARRRGVKVLSTRRRSATPPAFADLLLGMVRGAR